MKPRIRDRLDVSNFDRQFTSQKVELSPTDDSFMLNMDQSMFDGFSYTNQQFKYMANDQEDEQLEIVSTDIKSTPLSPSEDTQ